MSGGFSMAYRSTSLQVKASVMHGYVDPSAPMRQDGHCYDPRLRAFQNCSNNHNEFNNAETNFAQPTSTPYHPPAAVVAPSTPAVTSEQQQAITQQQPSDSSVCAPSRFEAAYQGPAPALGWTAMEQHLQTYVQGHLSSGGQCQVVGYTGTNNGSAPYSTNSDVGTPPTPSTNHHGATPVYQWMQRKSKTVKGRSRRRAGENHF
ncbi:hypothetical protein MTO96_040390 [Rhipicephalus appendiculatus]